MFKEFMDRRRLDDEVMLKLLKHLDIPNAWIYNGERKYKHIDTDIVIEWGYEGGYGGDGTTHRRIIKPIHHIIPRRFKRAIGTRLDVIKNRDRSPNDLLFFNEYMDGSYTQQIEIKSQKKSEITIWMIENKITEWHIIGEVVWFKNEEDAMATKLMWIE